MTEKTETPKREKVKRLGKDAWGQPQFEYRGIKFYRHDDTPAGYWGRYRCLAYSMRGDSYQDMLNEIDQFFARREARQEQKKKETLP